MSTSDSQHIDHFQTPEDVPLRSALSDPERTKLFNAELAAFSTLLIEGRPTFFKTANTWISSLLWSLP
jgi:hypothetical protein